MIAAITSCTNTSNPAVMVGAGLLARNAAAKGLTRKPWVKTSLAPGSKVVTDYLKACGLLDDLDTLGFNLVGYGCTTCIGNSGPLPDEIAAALQKSDVVACAVLSRQPQLRGPHPPASEDELPRVAAARRRVRDRRQHEARSLQGAARHRQGRQARLPARRLAVDEGDPRPHREARDLDACSSRATRACSRATRTGRPSRRRRARTSRGPTTRPT